MNCEDLWLCQQQCVFHISVFHIQHIFFFYSADIHHMCQNKPKSHNLLPWIKFLKDCRQILKGTERTEGNSLQKE